MPQSSNDISLATLKQNAYKIAWIRMLPRPDQTTVPIGVNFIMQQDGKSHILTQKDVPLRKVQSA